MEELPGDWVFIDWVSLDNRGEVSLEVMALFADLMDDSPRSEHLSVIAEELKHKIFAIFWDEEQGCLVHHRVQGQWQQTVSLYPNMFALLFGYFTEEQIEQTKRSVFSGTREQEITTPYMRFFELSMRCELGEHRAVLTEIVQYWGEMLKLVATTFWEAFDPGQQGSEHYAMYGRPFGKSLCHAWGASPLYLLGRYFLGVRPLTPGYQTYRIEPQLGGLERMNGTVPIPGGYITVSADRRSLMVRATGEFGYLRFQSGTLPDCILRKPGLCVFYGYKKPFQRGKSYWARAERRTTSQSCRLVDDATHRRWRSSTERLRRCCSPAGNCRQSPARGGT